MPAHQLFDNHGRPLEYLRLAVTDRCNLRCFYCMPEEGINYLPKKALLTFEEMIRLVELLAAMGISKVRITGGEPFLRKDLMELLRSIRQVPGIRELHLTTNGLLTGPHIPGLKALGINSVNMSLDTLDPERFRQITRRDEFHKTWNAFLQLRDAGIPVKINMVVMDGRNTEDIIPMAELTRDKGVQIRFIEEMPFNGTGVHPGSLRWNYRTIHEHLLTHYPGLTRLAESPGATATGYQIPGYEGRLGIIAAFSRTFCGTCNRIRLTAQGVIKTCLYDQGVLNVRDLIREGSSDDAIREALLLAFNSRPKDGFEAEQRRRNSPVSESMSTIGG